MHIQVRQGVRDVPQAGAARDCLHLLSHGNSKSEYDTVYIYARAYRYERTIRYTGKGSEAESNGGAREEYVRHAHSSSRAPRVLCECLN